jgi:hypothetical protein
MNVPLVVSFYTPDWEYPTYAKNLQADCDRLNLDCYIEEKFSLENYVNNCNIKPFFIKECLEKFQRPILWMDVDATINKLPEELLDAKEHYDLAVHLNSKFLNRFYVNSIWFNYTPVVLKLVNSWCNKVVGFIDDGAFNESFKELYNEIRFLTLPSQQHIILTNPHTPIPQDSYFVHRLSNSTLKQDYKNKVKSNK